MTPEDAIHLLHKAGCPPDVIAHARAVAECAREIAERYNERHRNHAEIELVNRGRIAPRYRVCMLKRHRLRLPREDYLSFTAMDCATSVALEKQNQSMSGQLHL